MDGYAIITTAGPLCPRLFRPRVVLPNDALMLVSGLHILTFVLFILLRRINIS